MTAAAVCRGGTQWVDSMTMTDVSRVLNAVEHGDLNAGAQFLPLVYDNLRKLAAQ